MNHLIPLGVAVLAALTIFYGYRQPICRIILWIYRNRELILWCLAGIFIMWFMLSFLQDVLLAYFLGGVVYLNLLCVRWYTLWKKRFEEAVGTHRQIAYIPQKRRKHARRYWTRVKARESETD